MSFEVSFLDEKAAAYATRHVARPYDAVMRRMEREIRKERQPAVGLAVGSLLQTLAAASGARRIVEVGTNVGYSGMWLLAGAPQATLDTIEFDAAIAARAQRNFADAGVATRARVHLGAALDVLPKLAPPADLVFLDAAKSEYPDYVEHALRLLRPGGILAADNAFWLGRALDAAQRDADTRGVRKATKMAFEDPRFVGATIVPAEDGVLVAVRKA